MSAAIPYTSSQNCQPVRLKFYEGEWPFDADIFLAEIISNAPETVIGTQNKNKKKQTHTHLGQLLRASGVGTRCIASFAKQDSFFFWFFSGSHVTTSLCFKWTKNNLILHLGLSYVASTRFEFLVAKRERQREKLYISGLPFWHFLSLVLWRFFVGNPRPQTTWWLDDKTTFPESWRQGDGLGPADLTLGQPRYRSIRNNHTRSVQGLVLRIHWPAALSWLQCFSLCQLPRAWLPPLRASSLLHPNCRVRACKPNRTPKLTT